MRIAVIGGAGFIGSHLVDRLLVEGHDVDVIDDLSDGSLANLAEARQTSAAPTGGVLKIHHMDAVTPAAETLVGMRRPELVYHLALFSRTDASPRAQGRAFESALAVMEAARKFGVSKVIATLPASALYGQPATSALPVKEGTMTPRGVRGVVARAVVDLMATYRERDMIEFTALAMSTVYGPRQKAGGGVVGAFSAAFREGRAPRFDGDGRQTRDLLFIDDAIDALVRSSERGSGLLINVGTGVQTAVRDLWSEISFGGGVEPAIGPPRGDELIRFAISPVRARIHLGWSPWTELSDGVSRL